MSCNTLALGRPTSSSMTSVPCSSSCSGGGAGTGTGTNCPPGVGARPKREQVREQIRDYILHMLGAPTIKRLELDEQNIDFCINRTLRVMEEYAPSDYFSYYTFTTTPGRSVYELPPNVGYVRSVEYKNIASFSFTSADLGGSIPIEYFYPGGGDYAGMNGGLVNPISPIWGQAGQWTLYKQYEQMYSKLASNIGGWEYVGGHRHIKLYPVPCGASRVAVKYIQRCKDWEEVSHVMEEGALSFAKEILGRIRSRIKNPPGPNGGVQLDGDQLLMEAKEERQKWMEDLNNRWGDPLPIFLG
jgi:hypothetical protein